MTAGQIIVLIIIGALAGTAVAALFKRNKKGIGGLIRNTIIGVLGAVVGGFIFDAVGINPTTGILAEAITLGSVLAAFVGAIIVVIIVDAISR